MRALGRRSINKSEAKWPLIDLAGCSLPCLFVLIGQIKLVDSRAVPPESRTGLSLLQFQL